MTDKLREISQRLQSHDEADRRSAIVDMARLRDPRVIPALQKIAVTDESIRVRYYAKKALTLIRGAAAADTPEIRPKNAVKAPGQINLNALQKGLADDSPEVRLRTIDAAARFGDPRAVAHLARRLKIENSVEVLPRLILSLGVLGNEKVVPYLVDFLTAEAEETRASAAEALGYIGHSSAFSYLILSLTDDSLKVRASIAKALKAFGKSRTLQLLKGMLKEKPPRVRLKVVRALSLMKSEEALPILAVALKDDTPDVVEESRRLIEGFARDGSEMAIRILDSIGEIIEAPPTRIVNRFTTAALSNLKIMGESERLSAIHKVIDTSDTDALPMLREWLETEMNSKVLSKAIIAVGRLGNPLDRDFLSPYLTHEDSRVRANCVEAIGLLGINGYEGQIVGLMDDSNNRVRANAIIALKDHEKVRTARAIRRMASSADGNDRKSAVFVAADRLFEEDVEVLENLLNDVDKSIRKRAFDALKIFRDKGSRSAAVILRDIIEGRRSVTRDRYDDRGSDFDYPGPEGESREPAEGENEDAPFESMEPAAGPAATDDGSDQARADGPAGQPQRPPAKPGGPSGGKSARKSADFPEEWAGSVAGPVVRTPEPVHTVNCPECGFENDSWRMDCRKCKAPLKSLADDIPPIVGAVGQKKPLVPGSSKPRGTPRPSQPLKAAPGQGAQYSGKPQASAFPAEIDDEETGFFEGFVEDLKSRSMVGRIGIVSLVLFILIYLPLIFIMLLQTYVLK